MSSVVQGLDGEISVLEGRITRLREIRGQYLSLANAPPPRGRDMSVQQVSESRAPRTRRGGSESIVDAAARFVRASPEPMTTIQILERLESAGVSVGGKSPKNNLSALLSNSGLFVSHGRAGWQIADPYGDEVTEQEAFEAGQEPAGADSQPQAGESGRRGEGAPQASAVFY